MPSPDGVNLRGGRRSRFVRSPRGVQTTTASVTSSRLFLMLSRSSDRPNMEVCSLVRHQYPHGFQREASQL